MTSSLKNEINRHVVNVDNDWYAKGEKLGNGFFGTVYLCTLNSTREKFATKESQKINNGMIERERMKNLNHPNIIQFYDGEERGNLYFIYMEYAKNGSLESNYKMSGAFDNRKAWKYTSDILNGLHYLHHLIPKKMIHCDVKCANVLLANSGDAKLSDFGIASQLYYSEDYLSYKRGPFPNAVFNAPEIDTGGKFTVAADVWSLGVTVLEMKIGGYPKNVRKSGDPLAAYRGQFDQNVIDFVDSCLKIQARDRSDVKVLLGRSFAN